MSGSGKSLALYQQLIPNLSMPGKRRKYSEEDVAHILLNRLNDVTIFDCRALPPTFIDDTGDAAFAELEQTKAEVHLPFHWCYFEFADEPKMIFAEEANNFKMDVESLRPISRASQTDIKKAMDIAPCIGHDIEVFDLSINALFDGEYGAFEFVNQLFPRESTFFHYVNSSSSKEQHWELVGKRVLAVAVLLQEQMVINKMKPDPTPKISRERIRTQKPPVSGDTHVLTINVPIIRYQASRNTTPSDTHESPALHWRRGHWRIYHRGSNFEKTGWVRRCLVGDPAKGYQRRTQYRLVHRPIPFRIIQGGR